MTPAAAPATAPANDRRPRPQLHAAKPSAPGNLGVLTMRWLRRAHLYSGLAMLPFVLIYGISAFLFNHPGGAAAAVRTLDMPRSGVGVDAAALANAVAAAREQPDVAVERARLDGAWTFEFDSDQGRHRLTLPVHGSTASLRPVGARDRRGEQVPAQLFTAGHAAASAVATELLTTAGLRPAALQRTGAPVLRYDAGEREVAVSMERATVTQRSSVFDLGWLMRRLHTAHGYSSSGAQDVWAVIVDVMAASMVLWSVSGLAMWWQRRSHRRAGLVVLVGTVAGAVVLAVLLNSVFAR